MLHQRPTRVAVLVATLSLSVIGQQPAGEPAPLEPVPFTAVRITGGLWADRIETNRRATVPYTLDQCERTRRIANFAVAGGLEDGAFEGIYFNDSDVFKVVEGASYALAAEPDPELEERIDEVVKKIAAAQEDDGYLYTIRTIRGTDIRSPGSGATRWERLASSHELYNVGHLYEAAVAHHAATGKRTLLDVALKNAELIARTFGTDEGQRRDVPGHQEIEIGLVKLFRATEDRRWLDLARFFLDQRGRHDGRRSYGKYTQDHLPVGEQREAVGHAVRAGYQYAAMTDVAALVSESGYGPALDALWSDVVARKLYVTGGIGATHRGEAFGDAFLLPNETAYAETCAAIALGLWSHRMFLLRRDAQYVDVLERVLYNGFLSGVAVEGNRFFYPNPLACGAAGSARAPWFSCSCCPVNVVRFIPSVPGLMYAAGKREIYVNLYAASDATIPLDGRSVGLKQATDYPWNGRIRITVAVDEPRSFALHLRIPGWARGRPVPSELYRYVTPVAAPVGIRVNGRDVKAGRERGYATIARTWKSGDVVELDLPMPVRRVVADPRVAADKGRIAIERGPVVYCFEGTDTGGEVQDLVLDDDAWTSARMEPALLGGTVVIRADARRVVMEKGGRSTRPVRVSAIPYHLWAHREKGAMAVWLARTAEAASPVPLPPFAARARPSASHVWSTDTVRALNDGRVPQSSGDHGLPRHTWWDRRGSTEWVSYEFESPERIVGVEIYWFDDTGVGQCRVPRASRLLRRVGDAWEPVATLGNKKDRFNAVQFDPVTVKQLRVEADLQDGFSGGILEWRVIPAPSRERKQEWRPADGPLVTRWAKDASPDRVHREHPRPRLVRDTWTSLNGLWDYAITSRQALQPSSWDGKILVPFAVESVLSGVKRKLLPSERIWYRRVFSVPATWSGRRILLHFGAVDWETEVWVDGRRVGMHEGGYDGFTFDLGPAGEGDATRELVVAVWDPTDQGTQPRGKQKLSPGGIWYTPSSGIWQSVWLEAVPDVAIRDLKIAPDVDGRRVHLQVSAPGSSSAHTFEAVVSFRGSEVARAESAGPALLLSLPAARLWSPDDPALYDVEVRLRSGGQIVDRVASYFGMRKITLERDVQGTLRLFLNGAPLFQYGLLDQGFWPDGLYTAPTDEALRYDVEMTRKLGFNLVRKHVKIEPERWYWWCDRLGLLVWQDMPSGDRYIGPRDPDAKRTAQSARQFEKELRRLVDARGHHPSIVMWVLFNEGWGQFETERLANWLREHDPSRLVNAASGWTDRDVGDVLDIHRYPGPATAGPLPKRAVVLGEFGGLGLPIAGHTWQNEKNWGYRSFTDKESLTRAYLDLVARLRLMIPRGLAAAVYTQTTDVEIEVNGVMTYDRAMVKLDRDKVEQANRKLYLRPPVVRTLMPTSRRRAQTWHFSIDRPGEGWTAPGFDTSSWTEAPGGFGAAETPGAKVRTPWTGPAIWLRRTFHMGELPSSGRIHLEVHHDEDAEVWLNGHRVAKLSGYTTGYVLHPLAPDARRHLRVGDNLIAVTCKQTQGGQYIDAGLVLVDER